MELLIQWGCHPPWNNSFIIQNVGIFLFQMALFHNMYFPIFEWEGLASSDNFHYTQATPFLNDVKNFNGAAGAAFMISNYAPFK